MLRGTYHTILMSTCDLPLPWLLPTIGIFATARSAAQKANPRGRSSNSPLPEKCQLWLQGLPVGTVCPRLAAPVPLTCAFACQPLLHIAPAPSIGGQLQSKYMHAEGTNAHSYSRSSVSVSSQQPCEQAHFCQWKKISLTIIAVTRSGRPATYHALE